MVNQYRSDFPIFSKYPDLAYLDNAATTQRPKSVIDRISDFYRYENANIHRGIYDLSNQATAAYEEVRHKVADFLNAAPSSIGFTKGVTESINIVARSFVKNRLKKEDNVVTTIMEHHANFLPWQVLSGQKGTELRIVPIDESGNLDLSALNDLLDENTKLLAVNHISNTLGTINPIAEIIEIAHKKNVPVLVDAAQSAAYHQLDTKQLDCDFLTFSGHKFFGPFGIGVLYVAERWIQEMEHYNVGGGMIEEVSVQATSYRSFPYNLEAGTPGVADVIGLGSAIDYVNNLDKDEAQNHMAELVSHTRDQLTKIPQIHLVGSPKKQSGIISFHIDDIHPHDVASFLNKDHIAIRAGMHCTQPLLNHLDIPATIRASFSIYNSKDEIDRLCHSLVELIKFWS